MEKIIAMIDSQKHFTSSFCDYVNTHRLLPYTAMAFTKWETYRECAPDFETEMLLIGEEFEEEAVFAQTMPHIWLTDKASDPAMDRINRYQGAEHLTKEILTRLVGRKETEYEGKRTPLTAFYSPSGGIGTSVCAMNYACLQSEKKRVLYVSFEENSGLLKFLCGEFDLSDVMADYLTDTKNCRTAILSKIAHYGELDYIPPVCCPADLEELGPDDFFDMLKILRDPSMYDEVVADLGRILPRTLGFLAQCDCIYIPLREDLPLSQIRLEYFEEYLRKSRYANLETRIRIVKVPLRRELVGKIPDWESVRHTGYEYIFAKEGL